MNIRLLIAQLQLVQNQIVKTHKTFPDVLIASDEEGNSFGDIDIRYSFQYDKDSNTLVIYPVNTECEL